MMASVPGLGWPERANRGSSRLGSSPGAQPGPRRGPGAAADRPASTGPQPGGASYRGLGERLAGLGWPGEPRAAAPPRAADHGAGQPRPDQAAAGNHPDRLESQARDRGQQQDSPGSVSRGTGVHSGGRHTGWPDYETRQESETAMAEGRAWTSADQEAAGGGLETDSARSPAGRARHAGPNAGVGGRDAGLTGSAGTPIAVDTPIARAARAALSARAGGQAWPRPGSCRIITVANQKGGVGKTTTAVNLAAGLALHGARVLVVDLDPQGNASTALDVDHHAGVGSVYNVLVDGQPLASIVQPVAGIPHLYCAPATIDLAGAEIELVPMVARESRLARALAGYDASDLDYLFVDCPPSLGLLTVNALVAAPEVLIPIQCEYYALEGLEQLLRTVELVKSHLNPALQVSTILLTMFDGRTRLASQVADEVREHFGEIVLGPVIPRSVRVSEAPSYGQSVMTYDPGSSGAVAYMEAAREMAHRNARAGRTS
jgi:chromosome partitioning protein